MQALNFLRFWKSTSISTMPFTITEPIIVVDYLSDENQEQEDSFFDLEITSQTGVIKLKNQKQQNEFVSKRKILPIEPLPSLKPQSPIALLKSAQTLKVFKFKKPKPMERRDVSKRSLSVKFMHDDEKDMQKFTRETSVKNRGRNVDMQKGDVSGLDLVLKYLNMFKPFYEKVSTKKQNDYKVKFGHLVGSTSPDVVRRDDSLLQQVDGIQDAILHCKRSFNSSRDSSMDLSRKSAEEMRDDVSI